MMLCKTIKDISTFNNINDKYYFELKQDGTRVNAYIENNKITKLLNRKNVDILDNFQELKELNFSSHTGLNILDSELVVLRNNSKTEYKCDFSALLSKEHTQDKFKMKFLPKSTLMPFDILTMKGKTTKYIPLIQRKELLKSFSIYENNYFRLIPYFESVEVALKVMEYNDSEGLILKEKDSLYEYGIRSHKWLKFKKHIEKVVRFEQFENNTDNSITLFSRKHRQRVKCNNPNEVIKEIDNNGGFVDVEITGLEIMESGLVRMPILKRVM